MSAQPLAPDSQPNQASAHPNHAKLKNPDGSWKYTNDLANQTSPYLLQHAHNPVDWKPWGPEAFELARKTGKPIFLSIGYSTCYWCHVMERESFENPAIAAILNEHCVPVKVDREERPDVDDIYMTATLLFNNGQGGWPMSVFLTPPGAAGPDDPGLKPFFAGTYFPAEQAFGRISFPELIQRVSAAWRDRRDEVIQSANQASEAIAKHLTQQSEPAAVRPQFVQAAANQLLQNYDPEHGGFSGPQGPKFPTPNVLQFLLAVHENTPNEQLKKALVHSLDRMARGGMYDQIGGGFHRYSVDEKWLVPHFEKMLYDNGQLLDVYLTAGAIHPQGPEGALFARTIRKTCDYVLGEMTDPTGAFWSAQDAEVDSREGANYVWLPDQIRKAIDDPELAQLAIEMYGLDKGTNFQDPHHRDQPPVNVLYLPVPLEELADRRGLTIEELLAKKNAIDNTLYEARAKRKQPGTDDKVLTSWNGMMIAGLARSGRVLEEPRYVQAAGQAARYILDHMRDDQGGLFRTMRAGKVAIPAFLEDYAFFVDGLIELHHAEPDPQAKQAWLDHAKALTAAARQRFAADNGGYFDTLADQADLFVRTRSTHDGAVPTGNAQMIHNLIDLFIITSEQTYRDQFTTDLQSFAADLRARGANMAHMQHAALRAMEYAGEQLAAAPEAVASPAAPQPVTAAVSPQTLTLEDGRVAVTVTLTIAQGYHINAPDPGDPNLIPTTLTLQTDGEATLKSTFPKPESRKLAYADAPLNIYQGRIQIQVTLTADSAGQANLILHYQACTDTACLAPTTLTIPIQWQAP